MRIIVQELKVSMKKFKINSCISTTINTFDITFNKIEEDCNLSDLINKVLNVKVKEKIRLIVDLSESFPVSLAIKTVYDEFINSKKGIIDKFVKHYKLDRIEYRHKMNRPKVNELLIKSFDFYRLVDSFSNGYINDSVLIHLFNKPEDIRSYIIPSDTNYLTFLNLSGLADNYYYPLTGHIPDPHTNLSDNNETTLFNREYIISKNNSFMFPFPIFNRELSIVKGTHVNEDERSCINCNKCTQYCPESIYPQFYPHYLGNGLIEEAERLLIKKCTLCGICTFVCPVNIPIQKSIMNYFIKEDEDNESL